MIRAIYIMTFIFAVLFFGCVKTITVTAPPYQNKVSIQGMIEADSVPIIYFNRTVPYFDKAVNKNELTIRSAGIVIQSGNTADTLHLDSAFDKIDCQYNYYYKGQQSILDNTLYTLIIQYAGVTYTATATTGQSSVNIDSVSYTPNYKDLYGEHEGVLVYFKDNAAQVNYYRYEMVRYVDTSTKQAESPLPQACLGKDSLLVHEIGRSVYTDKGLEGQQITIAVEPAYSHVAGTKGWVYVQSIDKNAADFFDQLDRQKLSQYNPFVEPVFLMAGQFGTNAIGYFSAKKNSPPYLFYYPQ
jgi:hypothetical protein